MAIRYQSFVKDIIRDLGKEESKVLVAASKHVQKKMRAKVSNKNRSLPGQPPGLNSKNLRKGIRFEIEKSYAGKRAFVGIGSPAQHAHLLEFGTKERKTKDGKNKGRVLPRPFVFKTFDEEQNEIQRIMSEPWL